MEKNQKITINTFTILLIISAIFFSAVAITAESNTKNNSTLFSQQEKDNWTIVIYLDGDNNFCKYATQELDEIREVKLQNDITIVVLFDEREEDNAHCYLFGEVTEEIHLNEIHRSWDDEVNMGDQRTLQNFVTYAMRNHPAKHYLLELWGHGYGLKGMCSDETSRDRLTLNEISAALAKASKENNDIIDILVLTGCYMGKTECMQKLKSTATHIIASPDEIPATGLPHTKTFNYLIENPTITQNEFCDKIIETYHNHYHFTERSLLSAW